MGGEPHMVHDPSIGGEEVAAAKELDRQIGDLPAAQDVAITPGLCLRSSIPIAHGLPVGCRDTQIDPMH
jgi:hypothetical protein